ncbi:hypothetical protein ACFSY7_07980 [Kurthia populi]|uniref:Uncharacterized protein n=1 Tax=Kurthia populi TaxID=1562132 RepID=A0ABW5XZH6_9BACL
MIKSIMHKPLFFSDFLTFLSLNNAFFFFSFIALIITISYLTPKEFSVKILWIYCSLFPSFLLIIIRFFNLKILDKKQDEYFTLYFWDFIISGVAIIFLLVPLIIQHCIFKIDSSEKTENSQEYDILEVKDVGISSIKIMEYFVILILPFITIGFTVKDMITMIYVLFILIVIFYRLKIYYFNLPIMFFYDINEVKLSDGEIYYLISKNQEIDVSKKRDIIIVSDILKIARLKK